MDAAPNQTQDASASASDDTDEQLKAQLSPKFLGISKRDVGVFTLGAVIGAGLYALLRQ